VLDEQVAIGVEEIPGTYNCAGIVDAPRLSVAGSREVENRQLTLAKEESMIESVVSDENTDHVAAIVALISATPMAAKNRIGGQRNAFAFADEHSVHIVAGVPAAPDDVAAIVDALSSGSVGSGTVDAGECESSVFTVIVSPTVEGCGACGIVDAGGCELGKAQSNGD
jgi:hypothetical protein